MSPKPPKALPWRTHPRPPAPSPELARQDRELAADRRRLRVALGAAAAVHAVLFLLHFPRSEAAPPPVEPAERRFYEVHNLPRFRPPEPPPEPPAAPSPAARPVPVPEWLVPDLVRDHDPVPEPPPLDAPPLDDWVEIAAPPPPPLPEEGGPLEVAGEVEPPVKIDAPLPVYPEAARRVRREGTVILRAVIDVEGRVVDLAVLKGAPFGLTEAAVTAARRWRFRPATLHERPVPVYFNLTIDFRLH